MRIGLLRYFLRGLKIDFFFYYIDGQRIIRRKKKEIVAKEERKTEGDELKKDDSAVSCSNSVFPCMDKLREELSCAVSRSISRTDF